VADGAVHARLRLRIGTQRQVPDWLPYADLACTAAAGGIWWVRPQWGGWPLLLIAAPWAARLILTGRLSRRTPLDIPLALFLLTAGMGVWAAYDRTAAWARFGLIALGVAAASYITWAGRRWGERALGLAAAGCALLAAAVGAYFLLAYNWKTDGAGKFAAIQQAGLWIQAHRPVVQIPEDINGNVAGGALALLWPLGLAGTVWAWRHCKVAIWAGAGALLLALVALLLTASRGAWLGLAAGGLAAGILAWLTRQKTPPPSVSTLTLILIPAFTLWAAVALPGFDRWLGSVGGVGNSALSRAQLWRDGLALIGDCPFTGGGLGMTMMVYSTYGLLLHVGFTTHFHNLFLQVAFEQGLPGLAAFSAWLAIAIWLAARSASSAGPARLYSLAAVASLTALVIHGTADAGLYVSRLAPVLFLPIGFALGLAEAKVEVKHPGAQPRITTLALTLTFALILILALTPSFRAAFQANLATVTQTRTELSSYRWPQWPIQDAVRRAREAELRPAMIRYAATLVLDPRNVTANRRLGQIELSLGQYDTALSHLETAYASAPQQRATRQLLGESYAIAGDAVRATALWRTVDLSQGQLSLRQWWYGAVGETANQQRITQAIRRLTTEN